MHDDSDGIVNKERKFIHRSSCKSCKRVNNITPNLLKSKETRKCILATSHRLSIWRNTLVCPLNTLKTLHERFTGNPSKFSPRSCLQNTHVHAAYVALYRISYNTGIRLFGYWTLSPSSSKSLFSWALSPEIRTSSIDWAQLSRLLPEYGRRIQSPKCCF
jgi:hypothetical protein